MKSYPIQVRESRSWERNAGRRRRTQAENVKVFSLEAAGSPSLRVAYAKKKRRIRKRRLRAARRAAVILAAILVLAAIICKILAIEEPVEAPKEMQQETEAGELPHKATEPERVQQEPIQEIRSGAGNSYNEYTSLWGPFLLKPPGSWHFLNCAISAILPVQPHHPRSPSSFSLSGFLPLPGAASLCEGPILPHCSMEGSISGTHRP